VTTVGVTGSDGFIGWHVLCRLRAANHCSVVAGSRSLFSSDASLDEFVSSVDVIVHLAGMNRGDEESIRGTNIGLARNLVAACCRKDVRPHIIYANSIHSERDSVYGVSKRLAADALTAWAETEGGCVSDLVLPHVFGERGRPFYNSVVSTFSHQLAHGVAPIVKNDIHMDLVHAQQVSAVVLSSIVDRPSVAVRRTLIPGYAISVSSLRDRLVGIDTTYRNGVIPSLNESIDLDLFNTYRSYLFPQYYPVALPEHSDHRGSLVEAVKGGSGGQSFVSTSHPGVVRGNHFHLRKVERFVVLQGQASIRIRRLFDDRIIDLDVCGEEPSVVDIPTLHTHNLVNIGNSELLTLFWSHEVFDSENPDTYAELVGSP
jgi:UDP-2-acetamido-2,6-beta-L-arabino-hexul-4-ose reductase